MEKEKIKACLDPETLIQWIEGCKSNAYKALWYAEGVENPEVLSMHTNRIFGMQSAFDSVIGHLREMQGVILDAD